MNMFDFGYVKDDVIRVCDIVLLLLLLLLLLLWQR